MNAPSNLTPSQEIWARFYSVLHEEILKLEALAEKKTSSVSPAKTITEEVLNQRQQVKASVQKDSSQRG